MREIDLNEAQLIEKLRAGGDAGVQELAAAYGPKIYQLAFRYLRNREDAEEVTQDVLYKVHRKIGAFRGDSALSSWIYRITFNAAMSRLRAVGHQRAESEEVIRRTLDDEVTVEASINVPDWSHMSDERVFRRQLRDRVLRAIRALPAIYRAPVVLRDIHGLTTEEASARLRVKDQTLKSRLHRGRLILRKQLTDFAGGLTLHHAPA
jgi:RNA polymerase sigma-70 factor (ECF subfamily)